MSSNSVASVASAQSKDRTIDEFYRRVKLTKYVDDFCKDPYRLSNPRLLWDVCEWAKGQGNYVLARKDGLKAGKVQPAELRVIGEISDDRYQLYVDGGWTGYFDTPLEKARATGLLARGRIPEVEPLWPGFIEALHEITFARGPARSGRAFPMVMNGCLKLRHKIFEERKEVGVDGVSTLKPKSSPPLATSTPKKMQAAAALEKRSSVDGNILVPGTPAHSPSIEDDDNYEFVDVDFEIPDAQLVHTGGDNLTWDASQANDVEDCDVLSEDAISEVNGTRDAANVDEITTFSDGSVIDESTSSTDELGSDFDPKNWPCRHPKARKELDKLLQGGRYTGTPIPVFTLSGKRVPPCEYETMLKGALVDVTIRITNVTYKQWGFFADIVSIVILAPPGYRPIEEPPRTFTIRMSKPKHLMRFLNGLRIPGSG